VYQSETLATDLKIAADHGYVLDVELEMRDPAGRFEAARIGLLPASIVRRAEGLLGDPAARLSAEEMRHIDPKSLVPTGLQYLRGELAKRARAREIPAPKENNKGRVSGPQKVLASSKCQREPNVKEDEYCLLAIAGGSRTGRHFVLAPHQIILRRADIPRVEWTMAKGRHEFVGWDGKWYMGDVDLLKHKSDGPFGHVFHGRKGEIRFSVVGSTGGQRPAVLEIGVTPVPNRRFFPNARRGQFQRINSSMTELSPGKFVCEARWQTSNAVPGHSYEFSVRMRMPTPDATYYRPEYLEAVDVLSHYLTEPSRPKPGQAPAVQPPAPKTPASKPVQAAPPAKRASPKPG
jgi:hypothetical protein